MVVVGPGETGAALVHPPKSSSAATVGVGLAVELGAPQPLPMSLAVKVSGTFIIDEAEGAAGAGAGAGSGSGVFQALPPQGSIMPAAAAVAAGTSGLGGAFGCSDGLVRLNAEFISCCGEVTAGLGGGAGAVAAAGAGGGEESPKRSFERDDDGGGGVGFAGLGGGGEVNPPKPRSCECDEMEVVRDCCLGADMGEVKLSKRSPLADPEGEVTFGAAGVDLGFEKLARLAKGDGFSAGLAGGGEVVEGKLNPLNASVKPPMFEDEEGPVGEAMSPKELFRSCVGGAGCGCGLEYSDKIDCFRSGRDIPVGAAGVDEVLLGRLEAGGWVLPKKSSPSNESPGFCAFGCADCVCLGGGGARGAGSVVLGRAGGAMMSSANRSIEAL